MFYSGVSLAIAECNEQLYYKMESRRPLAVANIKEIILALLLVVAGSLALRSAAGLNLGALNFLSQIGQPGAIAMIAGGAAWLLGIAIVHVVKTRQWRLNAELYGHPYPYMTKRFLANYHLWTS